MLPGITPALFSGGIVGAGNDNYTKLLLHFDDMRFMNEAIGGVPLLATPMSSPALSATVKKFGSSSLYFNNSYAFVKNSTDFDFGAGNFTIDWWQYRLSAPDGSATVRRQLDNAAQGYLLCHCAAGRGQCYMASSSAAWDIASGKDWGTIDLNTWTHYAIVRSGNTFYLFKNGVQTTTWTSSLVPAVGTGDMTLGHWNGINSSMYLDEFRISKGIARWTANFTPPTSAYGPPCSDRSIYHTVFLSHFDNPTNAGGTAFADSSAYGRGNTGATAYGHPTAKFGSGSVYFNGANYYLSLPTANCDYDFGTGDFTIDWWDWRSDTTDARPLFVRNGGAQTYQAYLIGYQSGGILYCYCSNDNATWNILNSFSLGSFTTNTWSHRALVRKDGVFYGFKDGVLQGSTGVVAQTFPYYSTTATPLLGAWNVSGSGTNWSFGLTEELRISKGVARWTTNFTPPTAAYVAKNAATKITIAAPATAKQGTAFSITVQAYDANNMAALHAGTLHFTSTNGSASLPADAVLTDGIGTFSVTFNAVGTFTVTVTDTVNGAITATSGGIVCTNRPSTQQVIFLTGPSAGTWTVPSDWTSDVNEIHCIGGGSGGHSPNGNGYGGGGGAYSRIINLTLTPGAGINYSVGGGGGQDAGGGHTWFNGSSLGAASVSAAGGGIPTGGAAASGIGSVKYNGGNGAGPMPSNGAGGGGAGGPLNHGGAGGTGFNYDVDTIAAGGGGGGGGSNAAGGTPNNMDGAGAAGGNNPYGYGGAGSSSGAGLAGSAGGGGGGGANNGGGGTGGNGIEWGTDRGSGGGGGGGSRSSAQTSLRGGNGGYWGGGGGSAGAGRSNTQGGGTGAPGIICIKYGP